MSIQFIFLLLWTSLFMLISFARGVHENHTVQISKMHRNNYKNKNLRFIETKLFNRRGQTWMFSYSSSSLCFFRHEDDHKIARQVVSSIATKIKWQNVMCFTWSFRKVTRANQQPPWDSLQVLWLWVTSSSCNWSAAEKRNIEKQRN